MFSKQKNGKIITNSEAYKNSELIEDTLIDVTKLSLIKPGDIIEIDGVIRKVTGYNSSLKAGIESDYPTIGLEEVRKSKTAIFKLNSKGRNLRGQNQNITLKGGKIVDLFDLDISKLSYYLDNIKINIDGVYYFFWRFGIK